MLRFLADENFNNAILRGLLRRNPTLTITRVQDTIDWCIEIGLGAPIGVVIEELLLIVECSTEVGWGNQVWYLPMR